MKKITKEGSTTHTLTNSRRAGIGIVATACLMVMAMDAMGFDHTSLGNFDISGREPWVTTNGISACEGGSCTDQNGQSVTGYCIAKGDNVGNGDLTVTLSNISNSHFSNGNVVFRYNETTTGGTKTRKFYALRVAHNNNNGSQSGYNGIFISKDVLNNGNTAKTGDTKLTDTILTTDTRITLKIELRDNAINVYHVRTAPAANKLLGTYTESGGPLANSTGRIGFVQYDHNVGTKFVSSNWVDACTPTVDLSTTYPDASYRVWNTTGGSTFTTGSAAGSWNTTATNKTWSKPSSSCTVDAWTWTNSMSAVFYAPPADKGGTIAISGSSAPTFGNIVFAATGYNIGGTYTLGTSNTITVTGTNVKDTISAVIADGTNARGFTKAGNGTLVLSGDSNTYKGTTTISAGTLFAKGTGVLGAVGNANDLIANKATLEINIDGANVVNTLQKKISDADGTFGTLIKSGTGELVLGGNTAARTRRVNELEVAAGTLTIPSNNTLTVDEEFSLASGAMLKVGLPGTLPATALFGSATTVTIATSGTRTLDIMAPAGGFATGQYTLFGGAATGTFSSIRLDGTALTAVGTTGKWTTAGGDTVIVSYTGGVKLEYKSKGEGPPTLPQYQLTIRLTPANGRGGSVSLDPDQEDHDSGTVVTLTAEHEDGYIFKNWSGDLTGSTNPAQITMTKDMTVTAVFEQVISGRYILTTIVTPTGGGEVERDTVQPTGGYFAGTVVTLTPKPLPGYAFKNWSDSLTGTENPATVTMNSNKTVTANFQEAATVTYNLTVLAGTGGTVSPNGVIPGIGPDSLFTIKATPGANYNFNGWRLTAGSAEITSEAAATTTVKLTANATVTADFIEKTTDTYTLDLSVQPDIAGKKPTKTPNKEGYASGERVTIATELLLDDYKFTGWFSGNELLSTSLSHEIIMNGNKVITARFEPENDSLPKLVTIDTAAYLDASMEFSVEFTLQYKPANTYYYTYELMLGADTVYASDKPVSSNVGDGTKKFTIPVEDIWFDTLYTVYVRIVSNTGEIYSYTDRFGINVGEFTTQRVNKVGVAAENKVVVVDNGRFSLDTKNWANASAQVKEATFNSVEVEALEPIDAPDGFIKLSRDYAYTINLDNRNTLMYFRETPFTVSIKLDRDLLEDNAPDDYGVEDVRLYRHVNGGWEVAAYEAYEAVDGGWYITGKGSPVYSDDTVKGGVAYRLMINTKMPTVVIGGKSILSDVGRKTGAYEVLPGDPVTPGLRTLRVDKIYINSIVANTVAEVRYAVANLNTADTLKILNKDKPLKTDSSEVEISIHQDSLGGVGNVYGVLVYLIINNGSVIDTINMSRQVSLSNYGIGGQAYNVRWSPLAATVHLTDSTIDKAFKGTLFKDEEGDSDELAVDGNRYRLFRWLATQKQGTGAWTEYAGDNKQLFHMANGRLMWLRTDRPASFTFDGGATTTSLTDTFVVRDTLKSKQWTDLMLPFGFGVKVKDIIAASTGSDKTDSLYFYAWSNKDKNGKDVNYSPAALFNGFAKDGTRNYIDYADTEIKGPFTVYNSQGRNVILKIPPKPSFSSGASQGKKAAAKTTAGIGSWYYTISAALDDATDLASLKLGYYDTERIVPAPPTLGSRSVVLLSEDGGHMGYYLTPELSKSGGTFKVRFINGDRQKAVFKFTAAASAGVPEKMQLMFVNAVTGEVLGGSSPEHSITVAGNSHSDVYVVMGSRDYLNKTTIGPSGAKFAMGGITVNQAARSVRVKYYVPLAGTDRVEMSVYNLKGRLVWKNVERVRQSSWNTMEWRSRESRGGASAAGLYIIRIRAINVTGKTTAVENRKITFAR